MGRTNGLNARDKINNAAINLFIQRGFKGTTTKEIAKKAGIAEVTIYRHFSGKKQIASDLFINCVDRFRERLQQSIVSKSEPTEKLHALIEDFFHFAINESKAYNYVNIAHFSEMQDVIRKIAKPMDIFKEVIREGMDKGEFRSMDVSLAAGLIIGMLTRVITFINNGLIKLNHNSVIDEIKNSALTVLRKSV